MPLFYQHTINGSAKIGVWHIEEDEEFFLKKVPLQRDITHWHKRLQHLAGRYLLQELYPDFPYHPIEIADTRKPFLPNEEYHFSISHCGDYAAVIVSKERRVGIDIEIVTPKVEKIMHKFLNEEELSMVHGPWSMVNDPKGKGQEAIGNRQEAIGNPQPATRNQLTDKPINLLTLLWSCKEAVFKWDGEGAVDFRKQINLISLDAEERKIGCEFMGDEKVFLELNYEVMEGKCLVWVMG